MNYIIYDLEATCWTNRPGQVQETIEIGAVKMNDYAEIVGSFNKFIRPIINPTLSAFCKELTSIRQEDVNKANKFPSVIEAFQDWVEIFDEDYLLCSWGDFDRKMLIKDCKLHDMEYEWVENHIDIKNQYKYITRRGRPIGLKKALQKEGFEFDGSHHRGIDDAANAAKIFAKYFDEWAF